MQFRGCYSLDARQKSAGMTTPVDRHSRTLLSGIHKPKKSGYSKGTTPYYLSLKMNRALEPFGNFNVKDFDRLREKNVRFIFALVKLMHRPNVGTVAV